MTAQIYTPVVRLSYPNLFTPKAPEEGKDPVYSCALLFPKDPDAAYTRLGLSPAMRDSSKERLDGMFKAAATSAIDFFGGKDKVPHGIKSMDLRARSGWPFRDQGQRAGKGDAWEPGALFINVSSKYQPQIVDRMVRPITNPNDIYAGCWVIGLLNVHCYSKKGNSGVSFGLMHLQKVCDDDPMGGFTPASEAFAPLDDGDGAPSAPAAEPVSSVSNSPFD